MQRNFNFTLVDASGNNSVHYAVRTGRQTLVHATLSALRKQQHRDAKRDKKASRDSLYSDNNVDTQRQPMECALMVPSNAWRISFNI